MAYTKTEIELAKKCGQIDALYSDRVSQLIAERYSQSAEIALNRQRDSKPQEFATYFAYAEECKARAKKELGI